MRIRGRVIRRVLGLAVVAGLLATSVWLSLAADERARTRPPAGTARIDVLAATFAPDTFTTTYTARLRFASGDQPGISWALEATPDCGVFTGFGSGATWTHPHESQRGQAALATFPADRFCPDTSGEEHGTHQAVVRVTVSSNGFNCTAEYSDGSASGRIENPPVTCTGQSQAHDQG